MANNDMKDKSAAMTNIMENKGEIIYQTTVNMVEHICLINSHLYQQI